MTTRAQQLYKSASHKVETLPDIRVRLARFLREKRMARKAASEYVQWENGK